MSKWTEERQRDHYFQKARREGYRARAAYKLKQINRRYHLIRRGDVVVDLGCAPGSWLQVAAEVVGTEGRVIGMDLLSVDPIPGVTILQGDVFEPRAVALMERVLGGEQPRVVLSDMSPQMSGNRLRDHLQSIALAEAAFGFACQHLSLGGSTVFKVFEGEALTDFLRKARSAFDFCKPHIPEASRKQSSEIYLVGRGFRGCREP